MLARAVREQGRDEEALALTRAAEAAAAADDVDAQVQWRGDAGADPGPGR